MTVHKVPSCCCYSVAPCYPTLCNPMDCSTPGFLVLHHHPKFAKVHVYCITLFPYKTMSCSATVIDFCVLILTVSQNLLKISLQETLYAAVEFANLKTIFVPLNSHLLARERVVRSYPPSGQRQVGGEKTYPKHSWSSCKIINSILKMQKLRSRLVCVTKYIGLELGSVWLQNCTDSLVDKILRAKEMGIFVWERS